MAGGIDALLGLGIEEEQDAQALAQALRGRQEAADMFALSTVDNISKGAQGEQAMIQDQATTAGNLRKTMAAEAAKKAQQDRVYDLDQQKFAYEKVKDAAINATALEKARLAAGGGEGSNLSAAMQKKKIEEEAGFMALNEALNAANTIVDEGGSIGSGFGDWAIEKAGQIPLIGGPTLQNTTRDMVYDPKEQAVRGQIDAAVEKYRRAYTGANLTGMELDLGANWDPSAPGISTADKIRRTQALMNIIQQNRGAMDLDRLAQIGRQAETSPSQARRGESQDAVVAARRARMAQLEAEIAAEAAGAQ